MKRWLWLLFVTSAAAQLADAPEPNEWPACDLPDPVLFADLGVAVENLEFDGAGNLWLTAFGNGLYRADAKGQWEHIASSDRSAIDPPYSNTHFFMAVAAVDGALYVSEGHSVAVPVDARVLRFPVAGEPEFEVHAGGFDGANGLARDDQGNLYLAHGFRPEIWRIAPDGSWGVWTEVPDVANGIVEHPDGKHLVVGAVADASASVFAIPLDSPTQRDLLFRFNAAPSPATLLPDGNAPVVAKGIDDLAVLTDGRVVISAHLRDQFVMGDPETGEACLLIERTAGAPTSARQAVGFGAWGGWLFTTDNSGEVWAIDVGVEPTTPALPETVERTPKAKEAPVGVPLVFVIPVAAWCARK